jgi:hypothetical protein
MSTLIRKLPTMPGKECTRATATKRALVPKKNGAEAIRRKSKGKRA